MNQSFPRHGPLAACLLLAGAGSALWFVRSLGKERADAAARGYRDADTSSTVSRWETIQHKPFLRVARQVTQKSKGDVTMELWSGPRNSIESMTLENWQDVLRTYDDQIFTPGAERATEWQLALAKAGSVAGLAAVEELLRADRAEGNQFPRSAEAFAGWASQAPAAAWQWLAESTDDALRSALLPRFISGRTGELSSEVVEAYTRLSAEDLAVAGADMTLELIESEGFEAGDDLIDHLAAAASSASDREHRLRQVFEVVAQQREQSVNHGGSLDEHCDWLATYADRGFARPEHFSRAAAHVEARQGPAAAADWLASVATGPGETPADIALRANFQQWVVQDASSASQWLMARQTHPAYSPLKADLAEAEERIP